MSLVNPFAGYSSTFTDGSLEYEERIKRYPSTGICILIVGAGTAGAFAALECWRMGHEVRILEKASGPYPTGDSYNIGPSATKAFRNWPGMLQENDMLAYDPWLVIRKLNGEQIAPPVYFLDRCDPDAPARLHRHLRPRFQNMLLDYVKKVGIDIEWDQHVVEYFENRTPKKGGVVLSDGTTIESDLVIAADGVGTKSYKIIPGADVPAQSSGYSMYRAAYPIEYALADPVVANRFPKEEDGHKIMEMWMGKKMHGAVWRTDDRMLWSITHEDTGTSEESWSKVVEQETVLQFTSNIPGWPNDRQRLIKTAPKNGITDFKLVWRDPQTQWVSAEGRIIQIGDAAHTFLPSSGNGATQGIEDAVSLATCLQIAGPEEIPHALRVHNLLRRDRISCAQLMGVISLSHRHSTKSEAVGVDIEQLKKSRRYGKWIWSHDAEQYAQKNYKNASRHLHDGTPFQNSNIPPGYTCKSWTIADLLDNTEAGEQFILEGDWN